MVETKVTFEEALYKRIRDQCESDQKCRDIVKQIILCRLKTWTVPSLHEIQLMVKEDLMRVLFYTPESEYYYCREEIVEDMTKNESRQDVLKKVKALIARCSMNGVNMISEKGSEYERSKSVEGL